MKKMMMELAKFCCYQSCACEVWIYGSLLAFKTDVRGKNNKKKRVVMTLAYFL